MLKYIKIYEENKKLDEKFNQLYNNYSKDIIEKNILELLVEIGELANETRCFKYWSIKGPSSKEIILDEYADCLIMALYFCNMTDVKLDEEFNEVNSSDIIMQFKLLYNKVSSLNFKLDKEMIKEILMNLLNLGKLLGFSFDDIENATLLKINRNYQRFETGY